MSDPARPILPARRVLVTGASGFIGGPTCAALAAAGHEVMALVRRAGSEPPATQPVLADLTDPASLTAALAAARADIVVHLAAENGAQRSAARIEAANVHGVEHLIASALATTRPRIVFVSTVVTGNARGALLTEEATLPVETAYGRSKQAGERLLLASGLDVVVVRPCHVYGAGGWFREEVVGRLRRPGRFAIVGSGRNAWDVVHVDDLAGALVLAAGAGRAGEVYHCADDVPTTYGAVVRETAALLGLGAPRHVPSFVAALAAGSGPVRAVTRSARTSNAKLTRELGWRPRYPEFRAGLAATVAALG